MKVILHASTPQFVEVKVMQVRHMHVKKRNVCTVYVNKQIMTSYHNPYNLQLEEDRVFTPLGDSRRLYYKTRFWFWFLYCKLMQIVLAATLHDADFSFLKWEKKPLHGLYKGETATNFSVALKWNAIKYRMRKTRW